MTKAIEKRRTPRTAPLPGTEDPQVEAVRDAALKVFDLQDRKAALTKKEETARDELMAAMKAAKIRKYHDAESGLFVEIVEAGEKVKVRKEKTEKERERP